MTTAFCNNDIYHVSKALGFLLKGTPYLNNSVVALTAIGADNNALICLTNFTVCCSNSETDGTGLLGDWRLPDGSVVPGGTSGSTASITITRSPSAVLLHRRNNVMVPTGVSPVKSLMLVACSDLSTSTSMLDRFPVQAIIM